MGSFMSGRGTANLLTRTTAILAAMFMALSLTLALLNRGTDAASAGRSWTSRRPRDRQLRPAAPGQHRPPARRPPRPRPAPPAPGALGATSRRPRPRRRRASRSGGPTN